MRTLRQISICIILFSLLVFPRWTYASSTQAYQDYLYQFDNYRTKYNNFSVAKTEYLKYKTLLSETTALDTTESMMTQRTQLLLSYLQFLNEKLNENKGLTEAQRTQFRSLISDETTFLKTHLTKISTITSLTDATAVSKELETHYTVFQTVVRQVIVGLSLGDIAFLNMQYKTTQAALQQITALNMPHVSAQKQETIDRWVTQITNKETAYQQTVDAISTNNIPSPKNVNNTDFDGLLTNAQGNLTAAKKHLSDGTAYMKELINLLQYEE